MSDLILGIDVGGTTVKMAFFEKGITEPITAWEVSTGHGDIPYAEFLFSAAKVKAAEVGLDIKDLKGVGIALPGPVDENGVVYRLVNLGWNPENAKEKFEKEFQVPVAVLNDANAAALGEFTYGEEKNIENAILITLGTGVGGGIIVHHRVVAGAHGVGAEIGHFVVNPAETVPCNCGNKGCLEQYASATGIVRMMKEAIADSSAAKASFAVKDSFTEKNSFAAEDIFSANGSFTAKDVIDAAKAGNECANKVMDKAISYLAQALSYLELTTDPEVVYLGGGVSKAGEWLRKKVEDAAKENTHIAEKTAKVKIATLMNDAGIYGARAAAEEIFRATGK